jgi:hypothetical protein
MIDAGIAQAWPTPAAAPRDDERRTECYAAGRAARSLRMNFVSSHDGAATPADVLRLVGA